MIYRAALLLVLSAMLMACSATGPVRIYSGPPKPKSELAIIEIPAAITVLSIDGKEVDSPSKVSGSYEVQLEPGFHLIEFRYYLYWGDVSTGMMIKSKHTGVDAVFEAGKTYTLRYKVPKTSEQAKDFLSDFSAQLVDLSSGKTYNSYVITNLDAVLAARKAKTESSTATITPSATGDSAHGSSMPNAETATQGDPVKHLKFWWLMANPQQRKQFTDWMKTATENFAPGSDKTPETAPAPSGTINGMKIKP